MNVIIMESAKTEFVFARLTNGWETPVILKCAQITALKTENVRKTESAYVKSDSLEKTAPLSSVLINATEKESARKAFVNVSLDSMEPTVQRYCALNTVHIMENACTEFVIVAQASLEELAKKRSASTAAPTMGFAKALIYVTAS